MMAHAKTKSQRDELDEFTLARAQRGDADACRALFVRYRLPVGTKSLDWGFDGPGPLENSNSPEDRLANKRALLTLDDAIRKLPEAQRDALVLSILGELSTTK